MIQHAGLDLPQLSSGERDRRWMAVRQLMEDRDLDALFLCGWPLMWDFNVANARYLSPIGGNASHNLLIFPRHGEPTSFIFGSTFLEAWKSAQSWVSDVRPRSGGSWSASIVTRLRELGLERGRIGVDGLAGPLDPDGWLPHSVYEQLVSSLPDASFINLGDMMEATRGIKSAEEIELLGQAARLGDLMMSACLNKARPGIRECEVYADMHHAMIANGGEDPTLFLWAAGAVPPQHPFVLPQQRRLEHGDFILCEIHPKYAGYTTHIERTFCLGEPAREYQRIYDGCIVAYETGLAGFGPGKTISTAVQAAGDVIKALGLEICELGIHGHGLGALEYPRYRLHALGADREAIKAVGDEFRPGMVFAFNIDLFDPKFRDGQTGCVFAETIIITETGAQRMHEFDLSLQRVPV